MSVRGSSGGERILALHGNTQTGEVFRTRLEPLLSAVSKSTGLKSFGFDFPDGPVELEKQAGDDVSRRSWWFVQQPGDRTRQALNNNGEFCM